MRGSHRAHTRRNCCADLNPARAAIRLLRKAGAVVDQVQFVIDLPDLGGAAALQGDGVKVTSLFAFEGH